VPSNHIDERPLSTVSHSSASGVEDIPVSVGDWAVQPPLRRPQRCARLRVARDRPSFQCTTTSRNSSRRRRPPHTQAGADGRRSTKRRTVASGSATPRARRQHSPATARASRQRALAPSRGRRPITTGRNCPPTDAGLPSRRDQRDARGAQARQDLKGARAPNAQRREAVLAKRQRRVLISAVLQRSAAIRNPVQRLRKRSHEARGDLIGVIRPEENEVSPVDSKKCASRSIRYYDTTGWASLMKVIPRRFLVTEINPRSHKYKV
jgi:hypothetical protein